MEQESHAAFPEAARRAVAEAGLARRLREGAVALRRLAGRIKVHPHTGAGPQPSPGLVAALDDLSATLSEIDRGAAERAQDEAAVEARGGPLAGEIRAEHQALMQLVQATAAALEWLRGVLGTPNGAVLDAPYGAGAPRRHHPGALCTMVAERAEALATALETLAVLKANVPVEPS